MRITEKTTLGELKNNKEMAPLVPFLIYNHSKDGAGRLTDDAVSLQALQEKDPVWQADSMSFGLNTFLENAQKREQLIFPVYGDAAGTDPEWSDVKLIFFPASGPIREERKTVILAAGGAYGAVCSLQESFPVAAELSKRGLDVFCLNYRVADGRTLFPRPMEDMRAAVSWLVANQKALGIDMTHYAVGGFSAGGHLAACYGTEGLGFDRDGLPGPELLILAYPLINVWETTAGMPEPVRTLMRQGYLGSRNTQEGCRPYNVETCITKNYPAVWMIRAEDDPVVPAWNTERMQEALKACQIPCCLKKVPAGGHGWGLGTHTPAEGWTWEMLDFWKKLQKGEKNETV